MSEAMSLKRPRSTSNTTEEPEEKYSAHTAAQQMLLNPALVPVSTARGVQSLSFPLMQYCQMIQQMQHQNMEYPLSMMRKEKEDGWTQSASNTPASSRRQTMSTPSVGPRPIRVPQQSIFNPLHFGMLPQSQQLVPPNIEDAHSSSTGRPQSPAPHIYNVPSFQRADEEIYTKFVDSVRKLAAKLAMERS
ncbi:hypothetical protein L5515_011882 [Caenorhabditis briggsae]|uniref:Uncharacterized protein n=1 Tax=Caenorhabditis briggsae TaxID=6238 RepID=A0AAE9EVI9_CAEBR|nr:hypothetical protein L5515_011882 [Caenorhabditis briggsae]